MEHAAEARDQRYQAYLRRWEAASLNGKDCRLVPPDFTPARDDYDYNPLRSMAIARVPWLDTHTQKVDYGLHCLGCVEVHLESPYLVHADAARKYSTTSLGEHAKRCPNVVKFIINSIRRIRRLEEFEQQGLSS